MRLNLSTIFVFCISALAVPFASAWASDYQSPRTAALGGAGHAGPMLNDSVYLNPSFASFLPTYSIGLGYQKYSGGEFAPDGNPSYRGRLFNISVQDGRSPLFQAGVGYTRFEDRRMVHFGASRSAIQRLGFGIGGKFMLPEKSGEKMIQDMTFSTTGLASKAIQIAFIVDNLLETSAGKDRGLYREYIIGTKLNLQSIVLLYFDPHFSPSRSGASYGHETGIEFTVLQDFFLRMGMFRNSNIPFENTRGRGYGMGFGWVAPRISFDYGLSRVLDAMPATAHNFGMTMYF